MADNPYTPPAAKVADFAPPAARIRPRNVTIALWLIGASLALQFILQLRALADMHFQIASPLVFTFDVLEYVLFLVLIHQLAQGRRWPRMVLLLIALVAFASLCYAIGLAFKMFRDDLSILYSGGFLAIRVLPVVAYFVALHLLFFASGDWFSSEQ